jgi:hypothetical protein
MQVEFYKLRGKVQSQGFYLSLIQRLYTLFLRATALLLLFLSFKNPCVPSQGMYGEQKSCVHCIVLLIIVECGFRTVSRSASRFLWKRKMHSVSILRCGYFKSFIKKRTILTFLFSFNVLR